MNEAKVTGALDCGTPLESVTVSTRVYRWLPDASTMKDGSATVPPET